MYNYKTKQYGRYTHPPVEVEYDFWSEDYTDGDTCQGNQGQFEGAGKRYYSLIGALIVEQESSGNVTYWYGQPVCQGGNIVYAKVLFPA
jgi:hypothetical protein